MSKRKKYTYLGKKNKTDNEMFINVCKLPQKNLKKALFDILKNYYDDAVSEDGYVYAKGIEPVLLTAHMDTVHNESVKDFYEYKYYNKERKRHEHIISSPQGIGGDDRCGIYMILQILETTELRPSILFCEDEEIGGIGSDKFCQSPYIDDLKELKFFIELDRANANDAVFYDCGNKEFKDFVIKTTGYEKALGSFSDISNLSPATDVASVNLSCGYYNAHTLEEKVVYEEMMDTVFIVEDLIYEARNNTKFDYQEERKSWFYDDDWFSFGKRKHVNNLVGLEIEFFDTSKEKAERCYDFIWGESYLECLGQFFVDNPFICMDDIIDIQEEYEDDYYYQNKGYGYVSAY